MIRTSFVLAALAAITITAAPGFAQSLDEYAANHFNSSVSAADRQSATSGSVDPRLDALALAKFNHSASFDESQAAPQTVVISARDSGSATGGYGQLIASAGLSADGAAGLGLGEIAAAKFRNDQTQTER